MVICDKVKVKIFVILMTLCVRLYADTVYSLMQYGNQFFSYNLVYAYVFVACPSFVECISAMITVIIVIKTISAMPTHKTIHVVLLSSYSDNLK